MSDRLTDEEVAFCDQNTMWWAWCHVCAHQCAPEEQELFSIPAARLRRGDDLDALVGHLSSKSWFDFGRFMAFVASTHDAVAA